MNADTLTEFLDSIDGVAYVTDPVGTIVAYGRYNWNRFAIANGAPELTRPEAVLGRKISDFIAGEEVRDAYRRFMTALAEGRVDAIKFSYRCDGPGAGRAMQMSITRVLSSGSPSGFLFQSTLIDQGVRAPVTILDRKHRRIPVVEGDGAAMRLCSFCQRLCAAGRSPGSPANWSYEVPLAAGDHRMLHAVCPNCEARCSTLIAEQVSAHTLSPRQREVLAMLVRGHPNKMICAKLGMSPNTVKTHLRVIFRELQATNRTEAATEALRRWPDCASHIEERSQGLR